MPIQMPNKTPKKPTNWSKVSKQLSFWVFVILVPVAIIQFSGKGSDSAPEIPYTPQYDQELQKNNIDKVTIQSGRLLTGEFKNKVPVKGRLVQRFKVTLPTENSSDEVARLREHGVQIQAEDARPSFTTILISLFPYLLIFGIWFFLFRSMQAGGAKAFSFGKSKAKLLTGDTPKVTFDDVAGADEAKVELQEIIEFLKDPQKFTKLGGRLPKGALLVGPPGTGKTLLARAVAGEAGRPFFSMSGSDFVEMFVGVGASRVRDLFEQGKAHAPCIIFIDEIDAVGRHRGAGLGGGHNRPDVLDPALMRPGRFDRQIVVDSPDLRGREGILRVHIRNKPMAEDVDVTTLARGTPGMAGADLANLVNEGALLAARRNHDKVYMADLEDAKDKVMMGAERKSMVMKDEERKLTAYHEGGHAICAIKVKGNDPLHKVTIVPRGRTLGVAWTLPEDDRVSVTREQLEANLVKAYGGRVAEELVFGRDRVTTGASSDIQQATGLARRYVSQWGLSDEIGPVLVGDNEQELFLGREIQTRREVSERTAQLVDSEVTRVIREAYARARSVLQENIDLLHAVAAALLDRETLTGDEVAALARGETLPPRPVSPPPSAPALAQPVMHPKPSKPPLFGGPEVAPA